MKHDLLACVVLAKMSKVSVAVIAALVVLLAVFLSAHVYNKAYHEKIKSRPTFYCYDNFRGAINPAFIVTEEEQVDDLIKYYEELQSIPDSRPVFNFPIKGLPQKEKVYLLGYYDGDSTVAEVYSYYKFGMWYSGHLRGYVYSKTLHGNPPARRKQE